MTVFLLVLSLSKEQQRESKDLVKDHEILRWRSE